MPLTGTSGNDTLQDTLAPAANDSFMGLAGDDLLISQSGTDTIDGGAGFDTASFASRTGPVTVLLDPGVELNSGSELRDIDAVVGSGFADVIVGDAAANLLDGGAGADVIDGQGGDDTLIGGPGNDTLTGGDGFDMVSYAEAPNGVSVDLQGNVASGRGDDQISGIEGVIGSAFNDSIAGDDALNWLDPGTDGADTIDGRGGFDFADFSARASSVFILLDLGQELNSGSALTNVEGVLGTRFGDVLIGDSGNNWFSGLGGADLIDGGAGDDSMVGGSGSDTLIGADGFDIVSYVQAPNAVVVNLALGTAEGWGSDQLSGIEGVHGSAFSDVLTGDAGNNWLDAGPGGADTITGGGGYDVVSFAFFSSSVVVNLGLGVELNSGSQLIGISGAVGTAFGDVMIGDDGDNLLSGWEGADLLLGGLGNDVLIGGPGSDTLDGGDGFDLAGYVDATNAVSVNLATGQAFGFGLDQLISIEGVDGSAFDDLLVGNAANNWLNGGTGGVDTLDGADGFDTASFAYRTSGVTVSLALGVELGSGTQLISIEGVVGTYQSDVIIGSTGDNALDGLDGDDVLTGLEGNDTLTGGEGNDTVEGGDGFDLASFATARNGVSASLLTGLATGQGNDVLSGIEGLVGSAFSDVLTGDTANNWLDAGTGGADTLIGGDGFDTASFGSVIGTGVTVLLASGLELSLGASLDGIEGVVGTGFGDVIIGDVAANVLDGGAGDDVLDGGAGADTLIGGLGNDTLTGGDGFDLASFAASLSAVSASLLTGTATGEGNDLLSGIEGLVGSGFSDTLTGDAGDNWLDVGTGGADQVTGGDGFDTLSFTSVTTTGVVVFMALGTEGNLAVSFTGIEAVVGTGFGDVLIGDDLANWLNGGAGSDVLTGGLGNDTLIAGAGDDTLDGGGDFDVASYAEATGAVFADLVLGTVAGGSGSDLLANVEGVIGSAYNDTMQGSSAGEWLSGGAGDDSLNGGGGSDTLLGGAGNNTLDGGDGFDLVDFGDAGAAVFVDLALGLSSGWSVNLLFNIEGVLGSAFGDQLTGNALGNVLFGFGGSDTIIGGSGADTINGGAGADMLTGGGGADVFFFNAGEANGDSITDFDGVSTGGGDFLVFQGYGAGATFISLGAGLWQISDGVITDIIAITGAVNTGDWAFA